MPKIIEVTQGTPEWLAYKAGRASGSDIHKIVAKGRGSAPSATRDEYKSQKVVERLTGKIVPMFQTEAMKQGVLREPEARAKYAFLNDVEVKEYGAFEHSTLSWACASPDGIIGDFEGAIEVKSPTYTTHLQTLLAKQDGKETIQGKYLNQMLWLMACAEEIQYVDYISYCPDFPEHMSLYVERVTRKGNEAAIKTLEKEVAIFLDEVAATVEKLQSSYALKEAA